MSTVLDKRRRPPLCCGRGAIGGLEGVGNVVSSRDAQRAAALSFHARPSRGWRLDAMGSTAIWPGVVCTSTHQGAVYISCGSHSIALPQGHGLVELLGNGRVHSAEERLCRRQETRQSQHDQVHDVRSTNLESSGVHARAQLGQRGGNAGTECVCVHWVLLRELARLNK